MLNDVGKTAELRELNTIELLNKTQKTIILINVQLI